MSTAKTCGDCCCYRESETWGGWCSANEQNTGGEPTQAEYEACPSYDVYNSNNESEVNQCKSVKSPRI